MEINPYESPQLISHEMTDDQRFLKTATVAWAAIILLGSETALNAALYIYRHRLAGTEFASALTQLYYCLFVSGVICYCFWIYRSAKNSQYFSGLPLSHSAGMAVGYYFIPLIYLVMPVKSMSEIYSKTYLLYQEKRPTVLLACWWTAWIVTLISGQVGSFLVISVVSRVLACVGVSLVIFTLTRRQYQIMGDPDLYAKIGLNQYRPTFPALAGIPMKKAKLPEVEDRPQHPSDAE